VSDAPALLYLEADDEITAVVRRVRSAGPGRVVIVAPGRSRATSSAVALRLLAGEDREIAVVGDALTRSLAAEAGLASYATVDDARRAGPVEAGGDEPRHAAIHVVRGSATDETAPTLAVAAAAATGRDADTRPVPVVRPPKPTARPARPRQRPAAPAARRASIAGLAVIVGALLMAGLAAGAIFLPAATIGLALRSEPVGPVTYEIALDGAEPLSGRVQAPETVVATGTYTEQVAATGAVVLYNWTFFPVEVPAGTFVAAGEQAFATLADVVVPRGRLTGAGTILAGDVGVAVEAAAVGEAANVAAEAINVVVNEQIDARLRGFPENPEPRVLNPEPTSGGIDRTGPEITQADVDAAVAALDTTLAALVVDELPSDPETIVVQPTAAEPAIEGLDGLPGTRDQAEAQISGTLDWVAYTAARADVIAAAEAEIASDRSVVPEGDALLEGATEVTLGEARLDGERLVVEAEVTGASVASVEPATIVDRVAGLTAQAAEQELADVGDATVELWPPWVTTVPELPWRVEVEITGGDAGTPSPGPSTP
jgi:hypothetical protein